MRKWSSDPGKRAMVVFVVTIAIVFLVVIVQNLIRLAQ